MLDSDFLDSVIHSLACPVYLPSVGVDLILGIFLVGLYTFGCSVPFSCMIQYEFGAHWFTTITGSHVSILPVLDPNWCTWDEFNVTLLWANPLPLYEFLVSLVHFWGT